MDTKKEIRGIFIGGIVAVVVGIWFWWSLISNPFHEFFLIRESHTVTGALIENFEEEKEDYRGRVTVLDVGVYSFRTSSGVEFKSVLRTRSGHLPQAPVIEYLGIDPTINRIKGTGCQSVAEWLWRKAVSGLFLLLLFVSPGVALIRKAKLGFKQSAFKSRTSLHR